MSDLRATRGVRLPGALWSALTSLPDLLYPRTCAACGAVCRGAARYICGECQGAIEYHNLAACCARCGRAFDGVLPRAFTCAACQAYPPAYDAARSAAHFRGPVRTLLHAFKYRHATWLRDDLTTFLEACVRTHFRDDPPEAICPIPLHATRRRARGYNQSALLASELGRRLALPCFPDGLRRIRPTGTQTRLNAEERWRNIAGAFAVRPLLAAWFRGRCLLLVDDVMTTGATVSDAARALRRAGARRVLVATVARD